jgi:uncharacterized protein YfaS (alpha-2-macroglobulin family)
MRLLLLGVLSLGFVGQAYASAPEVPKIEDIDIDGDQLSIEFDRPMQTWQGKSRQTSIRISPEVDCEWTWEEDTTLTCDTYKKVKRFKSATYYQVDIGEGFLSQEGAALMPKSTRINTQGPNLTVEVLDWKNTRPEIVIDSSLRVEIDSIRKYMAVSVNGKDISYTLDLRKKSGEKDDDEEAGDDETDQYRLELGSFTDRDGLLKILVRPGLKSLVGPVASDQEGTIFQAKINEIFRLNAVSCQLGAQQTEVVDENLKTGAMRCNPETFIALKFSYELSEAGYTRLSAQLPKGVSLKKQDPERFYYYRRDQKLPDVAPRHIYYLNSDAADSQFLLKLAADISNTDGESLNNPPVLLFDIGDYPTKFKLEASGGVLLPGQKSSVTLDALNSNIDSSRIGQLQIDENIRQKSSRIKLTGTRNKALKLAMPVVSKNIQNNGGLALFGSEELNDVNYGVAYVPFNVLSYQSQDQVIVWATQWQSGLPLENAKVEILRLDAGRNMHRIGSANTNKDGVAKIDLNFSLVQKDDLMSLVRVSSEGKTVVSPALSKSSMELGFKRKGYSSWRYYGKKSADLLSFGATELPLYRPGENVNYRIWLREKIGNRLQKTGRTVPVDFRLYDMNNEKTLQTWQSALDGNESVSSSLPLSRLLPDGFYCINPADSENESSGACFQVARFDSQPLWATLTADKSTVLAGQAIKFQMEGGYFSGGPAANIELKFSGLSTWRRVEDQYPEFGEFTFINPYADEWEADGGDPLKGIKLPVKTDARGKAAFILPLGRPIPSGTDEAPSMAFGLLEFSAEVKIAGKASASSSSVSINYAQYPRYVGLKTGESWLRIDKDPGLAAVVIGYDGKPVSKQAVIVKIFEDPKKKSYGDEEKKQEPKQVGECRLIAGEKSACPFRAAKTGRYVFRAESIGAASTEIIRYIGESYVAENPDEKPDASLKLVQASDGLSPVKVLLDQPFENATVLFTLEYDRIVYYWTQSLGNKQTEISIPVRQEWAPGLSLRAVVRPAKNSSMQVAKNISTLDALLDIDIPRIRDAKLEIITTKPEYRPGEEIEIKLVNASSSPRTATMSVIDDSVYQQGSEIWSFQDPNNKNWLGQLEDWETMSWFGLEAWRSVPNIFYNRTAQVTRVASTMNQETALPVMVITREEIQKIGFNGVYDVLNNVNIADGSGLSTASANVDRVRYNENGAKEIEAVSVTGSRISRAQIYYRAPAANIAGIKKKLMPGKPKPRMRSQFMDAAYWNPDIMLAAGETRTIKFKLPDNLTQWRVLVWGSDDSDGFSLTQTSFKTNLPIEVRAGLPGQLFVGDKTRAQISARNQTDNTTSISMNTLLAGAGVSLDKTSLGKVAAYDVLTQALDIKVTKPGGIDIATMADSSIGSDGLSTSGFVQSRMGREKITQSGWLDEAMLDLKIPKLPVSAIDGKLDVEVSRGFSNWTNGWLQDLQDYPHRCWEQTLSRAVGAAYADKYDEKTNWSDRKETVNDALQVASSFKDEEGYYHYFQNERFEWTREPNIALSAYTLKSFNYLKTLGYPVMEEEKQKLERLLGSHVDTVKIWQTDDKTLMPWETLATAAGAVENADGVDALALTNIWSNWEKLSWFARSELALAMSRKPGLKEQTRQAILRLQLAGDKKGLRQIIGDQRDFSFYMGSDLRDQCAVVGALSQLDNTDEGKPARERLLRGVYDVYAGSTASLDTQSSAQCLMALHEVTRFNASISAELPIKLGLDNQAQSLVIPVLKQNLNWNAPLVPGNKSLQIEASGNNAGSLNYTATIDYEFDLQQAQAKGTGIGLQRNYDVLVGGKWLPIQNGVVKEGDWIRVRLLVTAPKERHFVAVSDFAPGGLVTRDITLSSVGGANATKIGGNGSYYFDSRQTGASVVRIYAEYLPAGRHEIYYYAQAVHPGNYFAPPAVAELMYGRASRANTSADRVTVQAKK